MNGAGVPQYERVQAVEESHWWFVGLRELVVATIAGLLPRGGRVLDAGCGTGRVLAALPDTYERVGVDVNPAVLEVARRHRGLELHAASLEALPFAAASFDAAFSLDVVSDARLADPQAALREISRVLQPGAGLVLNLPAYEFLRSGHDVAAQSARRYTAASVRSLLGASGLVPARIGYRMTFLFPPAAVRRLLHRSGTDTDVGEVGAGMNRALTALLRAENRLLARTTLPFGLSVFAVAHRPERPS